MFEKNLTKGSIPGYLINMTIPILIGTILHSGYSFIDMIWIGRLAGKEALAGISIGYPVIFLIIAIASGSTNAVTILVSRYYGGGNHELVKKTINNSFSIFSIIAVILTIVSFFGSDFMLNLMNTPVEIFSLASGYLKIALCGTVFVYYYLLITAILRGIGDTISMLIFMIISLVLNAILDPMLIAGFGIFPKLGLNGSALASIISQGFAFLCALLYLYKRNSLVSIRFKHFILDKKLCIQTLKLGLPSILQQVIVSLSSIFIITFVNSFGAIAAAAYGTANKIEFIIMMIGASIGNATSIITGQNLGAGKLKRVKKVFNWGCLLSSVSVALVTILIFLKPQWFISLITDDVNIIKLGVDYIRIVSPGYILLAIMFVANGVINGAGNTFVIMLITFFTLIGIRLPLAAILSNSTMGLNGVWLAISISFIANLSFSLIYYFSGKWKKNKIHEESIQQIENIEFT